MNKTLALCRFVWVNIIIKNSKCHFDPDLSHSPILKQRINCLVYKLFKNIAGI